MLVCVGDLLEEVLVRLPHDPVRGGDTAVRSFRRRGGSAANVAAIDAEAGGRSRFVGQVGDDDLGRRLVEDLSRRGVEVAKEIFGPDHQALHPPITCGDYLIWRFAKAFAYRAG